MESERENNNNDTQEVQNVYNGENARNMGKKILKPIIQEKIVKVPVTQYVEKIIEREEIKYVNKYVDVIKPIITYKTKHISKPIYLDKIKYETKVLEKEKIIHIPKIEYKDKIVEVPVYVHREKIIEKKVPLIIERVIPVLKLRTSEKNVLVDTIAMSDICDMSEKDRVNRNLRIITENNRQENSNKISLKNMSSISNMKSDEIDSANMKTYRLSEETMQEHIINEANKINIQTKKVSSEETNSDVNAHEDNVSAIESQAEIKNNIEFEGECNESVNAEEQCVNEKREEININVNIEEVPEHEEQQFYNIGTNSEFNTTRVSVHLAEHIREGEGYEQSCAGNQSQYNASVSNLMNMNKNTMFNVNGNKSVSEQAFKYNTAPMDPKIHSFPIHGNYQENNQEISYEQHEIDQSYAKINMTPSVREHYNVEHIAQSEIIHMTPSKQNFRPSYANSNGQAIISVRPATIVEYKPKSKKSRAPMCNFLNNCCRGNQD